jgi:alanine racemase
MSRAARVVIDAGALRHNLRILRARAGGARVCAVVKANAYGHGVDAAARGLAEADAFAVASADEALAVRKAGLAQPVVLLEGAFRPADLELAAQHRFEVVVHSPHQLAMLQVYRGGPIRCWLKVDTGMHRLGFPLEEVRAAWGMLKSCAAVVPTPGLMTHLARADEPLAAPTEAQLAAFAAFADLPGERSIANSAGTLAFPAARGDWVRPGIALYGIAPFEGQVGADLGLRPALALHTELIALRDVPAGESVGYLARWTAPRPTRIGIAALGYGDGFPRHAPNGTRLLVEGVPVALVGRVSMDMLAVDLTDAPRAAVGAEVTAFGPELPIEHLARAAGTIPYELTCGIAARVARRIV